MIRKYAIEHIRDGGLDVIGDIHGHADALQRLLGKLGYDETQHRVFRHPHRTVIFVGDFIDRGPQQGKVLEIVRSMCDAGTAQAVLGNHEFNAIGWSIADGSGGFLRPHTQRNADQHSAFLREFPEGSSKYLDVVAWFRQLPVWIEVPGLRIVHACWHEPSQAVLAPFLDEQRCFRGDCLHEVFTRGSDAYLAAEILLKGPEVALPAGCHFLDKDGHTRTQVRLRWWDQTATTFRSAAIGFENRRHELPDVELPRQFTVPEGPPVMFGHYWLNGQPTLTSTTSACVDCSVANDGYLTCYRWCGETELQEDHLVSVPAAAKGDVGPRIYSKRPTRAAVP